MEQIFFPEELQPGEKVHAGAGERHEVYVAEAENSTCTCSVTSHRTCPLKKSQPAKTTLPQEMKATVSPDILKTALVASCKRLLALQILPHFTY